MAARARFRPAWRRSAAWLAAHELLVLAACAPALIFPTRAGPLAALALAAVVALWAARAATAGRITQRTRFDVPILVLLLAALIGWAAAPEPQLGVTRASNLVLAVSAFYAIVNAHWTRRRLALWPWLLAGLAAGVAVLGLFTADWNTYKYPLLQPLYSHLPHLQVSAAGAPAGVGANELAGVLSAFLPAAAALVWLQKEQGRRGLLLAALALAGAITGVMLLTQARLPLVAAALVTALGATRLGRRAAVWAGASLLAGALVLALALALQPRLFSLAATDTTVLARVEVWQRGLWTLRDLPLTGAGLGAWPVVSNALYGYLYWPTLDMGHPHNFLLSAGAEMGLPGLVAALGLGLAAWRTARHAMAHAPVPTATDTDEDTRLRRALLFASAGGLAVFALFGIADAIALGARPGVLLWVLAGTLAGPATGRRAPGTGEIPGTGRRAPAARQDRSLEASTALGSALISGTRRPAAGSRIIALALAVALSLWLLLPVLTTNLGLLLLTRALWRTDGYALSTADPSAVAQAAAWLGADLPGAWRGRGFVYAAQGRDADALEAWQRASVRAEDLLAWGTWAARHDQAPDDTTVWEPEALAWYARAEALSPAGSRTYMFRALIAVRRHEPEQAMAALESALAYDRGWLNARERMSALILLGTLHLQTGDYARAEEWLGRAVVEYAAQVQPGELSGAYTMLGQAGQAQGHADAALAWYRRAAQAEPENGWRRLDLAAAYYEAGARDEALVTWSRSLAELGLQDDWQLGTWADFLARHGEAAALGESCAAAPAAAQGSAGLELCAGLVAWSAGRYAEAEPIFTTLAARRPRDSAPDYWLGRTYLALARYADARAALEAAVARAPRDAAAWVALGDAHAALGERTAARDAYEHALHWRPNDEEIKRRLEY